MDDLEIPQPEEATAAPEETAPRPETPEEQPVASPVVSVEELLPAAAEPPAAETLEDAQIRAVLEAIVYVADEPLTLGQLSSALQQPADRIRSLLDQLIAEFEKPEHGVTIREVAGGFKMATKAEHHDAVRAFVKSLKPPLKLSLPALETLAVIAYKQPVTSPEIMEIRGVQGAGVLKTLLDRKLIAGAGRKNVIGKPILYKTTKEFLIQFGLKDLSELPTLKEFEEIRRMAFDDGGQGPEGRDQGPGIRDQGAEPTATEEAETINPPQDIGNATEGISLTPGPEALTPAPQPLTPGSEEAGQAPGAEGHGDETSARPEASSQLAPEAAAAAESPTPKPEPLTPEPEPLTPEPEPLPAEPEPLTPDPRPLTPGPETAGEAEASSPTPERESTET